MLRRAVAFAAIAALIGAPIYLLFIRDDSDDAESSALVRAVTDPEEAAKVLTQHIADKTQGIEARYPDDWKAEKVKGTVRLFSDDDSTGIGILSKGAATVAPATFKKTVNSIKTGFKNPTTEVPQQQVPIAGLPTATAVVRGTDGTGASRSALVAVARGKNRAYVITVLSPPGGGGQIGVANLILIHGLTLSD